MNKSLFVIVLVAVIFSVKADTNVLQLVWVQPPGYESTLFTATNLSGAWTPLATNVNPVSVTATQSVAYFYVVMTPQTQLAGKGDPTNDAPVGATFVNTNTGDFWIKQRAGSEGWVWEIAGY